MPRGIEKVATNALRYFDGVLHPEAMRIFTPFTNKVPLASCKITTALKQFLTAYEPKVEKGGLFPHQADFLTTYCKVNDKNFIITTATGSGKSLCFLAYVFDQLTKDKNATALLCFPTQALMWSQAERLVRLTDKKTLAYPGGQSTAYGGTIKVGKESLGWTIWERVGWGATRNEVMVEHENSSTFASARVRVSTLDKAHFSLFMKSENKDFAARLRCLVLDEAHTYDGIFGANVHYFLKRVYLPGQFSEEAASCHSRIGVGGQEP